MTARRLVHLNLQDPCLHPYGTHLTANKVPNSRMVYTCCVVGCNVRRSKEEDLAFHKFPWRDEGRARKWITNIGREPVNGKPWTPSPHDRVCGKHFVDADYQVHTKLRTLVANAIPTVFPDSSEDKKPMITLPKSQKRPLEIALPFIERRRKKLRVDVLKSESLDQPYTKDSLEKAFENQVKQNKILTEKLTRATKELNFLRAKVTRQAKEIKDLENKERRYIVTV
ncbi:hypothetical protein EGW08_006150 [Elysia chlorotica]|uniref:THAP-type domain-containing protein n=1 Tax=Elysia chlorotica TaxID=188477 RepID=A0A433TX02_ELYCH|nr:hypothetical protein EGW08_006150 [Elysia chlorotica]